MDGRTAIERALDRFIGLPLYYCADCQRPARVSVVDGVVGIHRKCQCVGMVNAPRRVFLHGADGEPRFTEKVRIKWSMLASKITGRCV